MSGRCTFPDCDCMRAPPCPHYAHRPKVEAFTTPHDAVVEKLRAALTKLETSASEVARYGAATGPQWSRLNVAILSARTALRDHDAADKGE